MKQLIGNKFLLNGTIEQVLKLPASRMDNVAITMGGLLSHRTDISLVEFEKVTGYCFKDLEPPTTRLDSETVDHYVGILNKMDMTVLPITDPIQIINSEIAFTNKSNSPLKATLNAIHRGDGGFLVSIRKSTQYGAKQSQTIAGNNLEVLLETAVDILEGYISSKVQVTSKKLDAKSKDRKFDGDGIPFLFENESVESYFYSQSKPAGVAINNKGRFQVFTSYETAAGDRKFHYKTKDYASLKNAEKALSEQGFSVDGKFLDGITEEDLRIFESDCRKFMRIHQLCWRTGVSMAEIDIDQGSFIVSEIYKEEDPDEGFLHYYNTVFENDATGKRIELKNRINIVDSSAFTLSDRINKFIQDCVSKVQNGNLEYDQDMRTLDDRIEYHKNKFNSHSNRLKTITSNYKKLVDSKSSPGQWEENYKNLMEKTSEKVDFHKSALESLGKEVDKVESNHSLDNGSLSL